MVAFRSRNCVSGGADAFKRLLVRNKEELAAAAAADTTAAVSAGDRETRPNLDQTIQQQTL